MRLELGAAIGVPARIIERDAALPQLGRAIRNQPGHLIEAGDGFLDPAALEISDGASVYGLGIFPGILRGERGHEPADGKDSSC
jgi:hypothetical protein